MAPATSLSSEAGFEDMGGEGVHAGDDAREARALENGQGLPALLRHDGRGFDESSFGGNGGQVRRHDLVDGDAGAFEGLPAVLLRVPERHDTAENIEKPRGLDLCVLEDEVALGDYPEQSPVAHDRGAGDPGLGEELDRFLYGALGSQNRPVGVHDLPNPKLPDVLLLHALPLYSQSPRPADTTPNGRSAHASVSQPCLLVDLLVDLVEGLGKVRQEIGCDHTLGWPAGIFEPKL